MMIGKTWLSEKTRDRRRPGSSIAYKIMRLAPSMRSQPADFAVRAQI
jgi:hypothetical protein